MSDKWKMKKTLTIITWATEKWSSVSLQASYFRESLISAQRFVHSDALKQQYGSFTEDKDKAGSAKVINLGM